MKRRILIITAMLLCFFLTSGLVVYGAELSQEEMEELKAIIQWLYVDPLTPQQMDGDTVEEVFENLDEHSQFFDPDEFARFFESLTGSYAGIGAYVQEQEGKILIAEPIAGAPAERAGLKPNDQVVEIDGASTQGLTVDEAVALIRGPVGTQVVLTIFRSLTGETLEIPIVREEIEIKTVSVEILDGIGYIKITSFTETTYRDFFKAITQLYDAGVEKLVLDLRDNGGGLLEAVVDVARLLVPKGPIVHIQYNDGRVTYPSFLRSPIFSEMVVLINENSASAAEILAGAINDTGAGVLVGAKSYGKGSVQRIFMFYSGSGFKITEARYLSPNGNQIDGIGIQPQYQVSRFPESLHLEEILPLLPEYGLPVGSLGDRVIALQQRLTLLGYEIQDERGVFGESTLTALQAFAQSVSYTSVPTEATVGIQRALITAFVERVYSREFDQQLSFALDYVNSQSKPIPKLNSTTQSFLD